LEGDGRQLPHQNVTARQGAERPRGLVEPNRAIGRQNDGMQLGLLAPTRRAGYIERLPASPICAGNLDTDIACAEGHTRASSDERGLGCREPPLDTKFGRCQSLEPAALAHLELPELVDAPGQPKLRVQTERHRGEARVRSDLLRRPVCHRKVRAAGADRKRGGQRRHRDERRHRSVLRSQVN